MAKFVVITLVAFIAFFFIVRAIMKLPSKYERRPKNLSPWNALDEGIDPSISDKPTS